MSYLMFCFYFVVFHFLVWSSVSLYLNNGGESVLALDHVDDFHTLPLTYEVYQQWPSLSTLQKLPFLIDGFYIRGIRREFLAMASPSSSCSSSSSSSSNEEVAKTTIHQIKGGAVGDTDSTRWVIQYDTLVDRLAEFQGEAAVKRFFVDCDTNDDEVLGWEEFLVCRGSYDAQINPVDLSEYDYLENIIISDFYDRLKDPHDPLALDLLQQGLL
eukprot:gene1703-1861_t